MTSTGFRAAVEARDIDAMGAVLHPDIVFRSPVVHRPYEGRPATLVLLRAVLRVFEDFRYVAELSNGELEVLHFEARIGDRTIDGIDLLRHDSTGLVTELTVFVRPYSAATVLRDAMASALAG